VRKLSTSWLRRVMDRGGPRRHALSRTLWAVITRSSPGPGAASTEKTPASDLLPNLVVAVAEPSTFPYIRPRASSRSETRDEDESARAQRPEATSPADSESAGSTPAVHAGPDRKPDGHEKDDPTAAAISIGERGPGFEAATRIVAAWEGERRGALSGQRTAPTR